MTKLDSKKACVREYLKYVRSLTTRIEMLQDQIEHKRALMEVSGIQLKERVTSSIQDDHLIDAIDDIKTLIRDFAKELSNYVEQHRIAYDVFSKLPTVEATRAMVAYYLNSKSWEEVCVEMNYSWDGIMSLRRRSVNQLYEYIPSEWKNTSSCSHIQTHLES